jgi:uncharacterized protein YndB with AHSA1/START domain
MVGEGADMADMHLLVQVDGVDAAAAYAALTTTDGINGWWTSRATGSGGAAGDRLSMSFPDAPVTWDMTVVEADRPVRVAWNCTGGPPGWPGTRVAWSIETVEPGVVVRLDHTGFGAVDDMFRIVTVGWAQMLLSLKDYLTSGVRKPFFDF